MSDTEPLILPFVAMGGAKTWRKLRLVPVRRRDGTLEETVISIRDVTAERELVEQLRAREAEVRRLALVARHAQEAILITDEEGRALWVNPGFSRVTGYAPEEVIGRRPGELLQGPETDPRARGALAAAIRARRPERVEIVNYSKTGEAYWLQIQITPVAEADGPGTPALFIGVSRDVTERVRREMAITEARKAAEGANHAKSAFLARVSHELRTPLNGISGIAALLKESGLDERQQALMAHLDRSAARLLEVVEDILAFAEIRAETPASGEAAKETARPEAMIGDALSAVAPAALRKRLTLVADPDPAAPRAIFADESRIARILGVFVGNAVKFADAGFVSAAVRLVGGSAARGGRARLRFEVADSGPGVPEAKRRAIFERFEQADGSDRREAGGLGLGLSIARGLADALGGQIGCEAREGGGAVFWLEIEAAVAEPAQDPQHPALSGRRILVIDGAPESAAALAAMIAGAGAAAEIAAAPDHRRLAAFDAVVADADALPGGGDARVRAALIRAAGGAPVIFIAAHGGDAPEEEAAFIARPVLPEPLAAALESALRRPIEAAVLRA